MTRRAKIITRLVGYPAFAVLTVILWLAFCHPFDSGQVVSITDGAAIPGAEVRTIFPPDPASSPVLTDKNGRFRVFTGVSRPSKHEVGAFKAGYLPLGYDTTQRHNIVLLMVKDDLSSLLTALNDRRPEVRRQVARLLGERKEPRAIEPLKALLNDEDESVRNDVRRALADIQNPGPGKR